MNHDRTYRPVRRVPAPCLRDADGSMRPHTYGVRVCSCAAIATEPCRPTACAGEYPCCTFTHPPTAHYSLLTANSSYTFSAKERDSETGLSYFGSRYYSSDLSVWLSVDPMSDKYPSLSPYVYCANNPVKLVDPNGEEIVIFVNNTKYKYDGKFFVDEKGNVASFSKNSFEYRVLTDLNKLHDSKNIMIRDKLNDMIESKHQHSIVKHTISGGIGYNHATNPDLAKKPGVGSDTETGYNPFATKSVCADGGYMSCATLAHELLGHGWNNDQGLHEPDDHITENGIKFEEVNAVNVQNKVLVEHHQKPRSMIGSSGNAKQIPVYLINHYYTTKPKKRQQ